MVQLAEGVKAKSILDYGCGKRTLEKAMRRHWMGVPVAEIVSYDPAIPGCEHKRQCDVVACIDVLEHIEPEYLDNVLQDIFKMMGKVGFLTIHTEPALKHLEDGRNAHLIQQPYGWWFGKVSEHFWITRMLNFGEDVFFNVARSREFSQERPVMFGGEAQIDTLKPQYLAN